MDAAVVALSPVAVRVAAQFLWKTAFCSFMGMYLRHFGQSLSSALGLSTSGVHEGLGKGVNKS